MLTIADASARVAKGAARLDIVRPEWWTAIDLGSLNIRAYSACVLGQVFGSYDRGLRVLGERVRFDEGFTLDAQADGQAWATLRDAWLDAITDRAMNRARKRAPDESAVLVDA